MSELTFTASTLSISNSLHTLLSKLFTTHLLDNETLATSRYLVLNFRDKSYSADDGGFIRLRWRFATPQQENGTLNTSLTLPIWETITQS